MLTGLRKYFGTLCQKEKFTGRMPLATGVANSYTLFETSFRTKKKRIPVRRQLAKLLTLFPENKLYIDLLEASKTKICQEQVRNTITNEYNKHIRWKKY